MAQMYELIIKITGKDEVKNRRLLLGRGPVQRSSVFAHERWERAPDTSGEWEGSRGAGYTVQCAWR